MPENTVKLADLKLLENNPRIISPEDLKRLEGSVSGFLKMLKYRGIIVDSNNVIIGGNQRYKALLALGYEEVPGEWVQKADDFTEEERKRFIITDNVGFGNWDYEKAVEQNEVALLFDYGLDVPAHFQVGNNEPHIPQSKESSYETQHGVVVLCKTVEEQKEVFEKLKADGYNLKIVST